MPPQQYVFFVSHSDDVRAWHDPYVSRQVIEKDDGTEYLAFCRFCTSFAIGFNNFVQSKKLNCENITHIRQQFVRNVTPFSLRLVFFSSAARNCGTALLLSSVVKGINITFLLLLQQAPGCARAVSDSTEI
jgi:hypothetical protein